MDFKSDIEIAQEAEPKRIQEIADQLSIDDESIKRKIPELYY